MQVKLNESIWVINCLNFQNEKKIIFQQAKEEFELLFLNNEEKIILQFIDVISWFNSKINDSTFETAVKHQL